MFYKDAKVYSDGSHYIAIPHTSNPCKRKRVVETPVEVPEEAQTISVSSNEPEMQEIMSQEIKDEWDFSDMTPVESDELPFETETPKPKKKYVKRSEVFEKLYAESDGMSKNARRKFLCKGMSPYFTKEQDADAYVASKLDAKLKSLIARKTRFIRKAYINDFNYFVTVTHFYGHSFSLDNNPPNISPFRQQWVAQRKSEVNGKNCYRKFVDMSKAKVERFQHWLYFLCFIKIW